MQCRANLPARVVYEATVRQMMSFKTTYDLMEYIDEQPLLYFATPISRFTILQEVAARHRLGGDVSKASMVEYMASVEGEDSITLSLESKLWDQRALAYFFRMTMGAFPPSREEYNGMKAFLASEPPIDLLLNHCADFVDDAQCCENWPKEQLERIMAWREDVIQKLQRLTVSSPSERDQCEKRPWAYKVADLERRLQHS